MGAASAVCASSLIRYYGTFVVLVSIRRPVKDILTSDNRGINEMFCWGCIHRLSGISSGPSCFSWRFSQLLLLLWFLLLQQRPYFVVGLGDVSRLAIE